MTHWLTPDEPATYCIKVQGYVGQRWIDNSGLSRVGQPDQQITTLCGQVVDQAALVGIISSLYGMGFSLLSVECKSLSNKAIEYKGELL